MSESDGVSSLWNNTRNTLSGAASGVAKLVVGHPFDTVKVRLQTETTGRFGGPLDCIMKTVRNEGFTALYKGGTPPLIGWGAIDSLMFAALIPARRWLQGDDAELSMGKHWMAGAIAGWTSCIVATPVELLKAKLQIQYGDTQSQKYRGVVDCVRQTWRFGGLAGFYQGMAGALLFRTFISAYFGSYEWFKLQLHPVMPTLMANFVSGGLAAFVLWGLAYPADLVKNRMMAQDPINPQYPTMRNCFRSVYQEGGIKAFYKGFSPCMLRAFPTNGAALLAFELVQKYL